MKLSRRAVPEPVVDEEPDAAVAGKGRPTPKRREKVVVRGPVTAPKTRKEAYARQRSQAKAARATPRRTSSSSSSPSSSANMSTADRRAALRSGEMLAKRDQGVTRKIARDFVDSRRLLSNYLLVLFPLMLVSGLFRGLEIVQIAVLVCFFAIVGEWWIIGRRIRAISSQRFGEAQGGNFLIGFYAGSRAYLPRRWRLPAPVVARGDEI